MIFTQLSFRYSFTDSIFAVKPFWNIWLHVYKNVVMACWRLIDYLDRLPCRVLTLMLSFHFSTDQWPSYYDVFIFLVLLENMSLIWRIHLTYSDANRIIYFSWALTEMDPRVEGNLQLYWAKKETWHCIRCRFFEKWIMLSHI